MKITNIAIKNFRAFPQTYQIDLHNAGKNLLVYGENGSGKSSLYLALKLFLESSVPENNEGNRNRAFETHQNIFTEDPGYVKLSLRSEQRIKHILRRQGSILMQVTTKRVQSIFGPLLKR